MPGAITHTQSTLAQARLARRRPPLQLSQERRLRVDESRVRPPCRTGAKSDGFDHRRGDAAEQQLSAHEGAVFLEHGAEGEAAAQLVFTTKPYETDGRRVAAVKRLVVDGPTAGQLDTLFESENLVNGATLGRDGRLLLEDPAFKAVVEEYAADQSLFFAEYTSAWTKLQENGVAEQLRDEL